MVSKRPADFKANLNCDGVKHYGVKAYERCVASMRMEAWWCRHGINSHGNHDGVKSHGSCSGVKTHLDPGGFN